MLFGTFLNYSVCSQKLDTAVKLLLKVSNKNTKQSFESSFTPSEAKIALVYQIACFYQFSSNYKCYPWVFSGLQNCLSISCVSGFFGFRSRAYSKTRKPRKILVSSFFFNNNNFLYFRKKETKFKNIYNVQIFIQSNLSLTDMLYNGLW